MNLEEDPHALLYTGGGICGPKKYFDSLKSVCYMHCFEKLRAV